MDRPLGPRQPPDKRHAAYEDIFGRPSVVHHLPPQQPYPRHPLQPPVYYTPQHYAYAPPLPQHPPPPPPHHAHPAAHSQHPRSLQHPGNPGVVVPPPTDDHRLNHAGLTAAQAYQAQVYLNTPGPPQASWDRFRSWPGPNLAVDPISVTIEQNEERLSIDLDTPVEDEPSELPWAKPPAARAIPAHRFSSASDTPPQSTRSSVASSSTSPTSLDHETLVGSSASTRRSSETSRTLPRLSGPRRERTAQDRAMSMSALAAPPPRPVQRPPIVYPALLSRVAEAFRQRIPLADRVKDGLTYKDAFDGREAVDRIAHIIKTTDRNLALLLGRALDAQKFFHDVTYDHRLRDSVLELYQFRTKLPSPFGSGEFEGRQPLLTARAPAGGVLSPDLFDGPPVYESTENGGTTTGAGEEEEALCYSIACPRRLEQQARLNMKPQPGLRKEASRESLGDVPDAGTLWIYSVPQEIANSVSDAEKKRQEAINEVIYTERDFSWVSRLNEQDIIPAERREHFLIQVFWNAHDIITVNTKLRDALNKRQRAYAVVEKIGDIFMDAVPYFEPFVSYGAHQLYGKYEFEKEKSANPAFAAFVEMTERLPESRKLELNAYLTKPTTRLARYPLLLEAVLKHTPDDSPDKTMLPLVVAQVRTFLSRVNEESGRAENRFNLAQLESQLIFKPGERVDLRLLEDGREMVQVYLFDHALLFAKQAKTKQHEQFRVYRRPIPLELLLIAASDDGTNTNGNGKDTVRGHRARQGLVRKSSYGSLAPRGSTHPPALRPDVKGQHWISFTHLGRKAYNLVLWANSPLAQRKWVEHIAKQQGAMRERSMVFDTVALSEGFFSGPNKVNCAAPFSGGRRIVYGTDDGVYLSDLREINKDPMKVLALLDVFQVDVLEDYQLLIVLSERQVITFPLDALNPMDPVAGLKRAKRIATHASFFKAGFCLGRVLVCIVKSSQLSSTFKTLEPIDQNVRGRSKPTFKKLLQGGNDTLQAFREFYIPVESTSIHYLKTRMCIGCSRGFEIVDLETLDTQGLLDPADESLEFVRKKENLRPMAIYRLNNDFLLCYDEFAFYVNKTGRRSRKEFIVFWEGTPTGFALHEPYVLAFEPSFVEIRHIETGHMSQVIQGSNLRLLFADTPPSVNNGGGYNYQGGYDPYSPPNSASSRGSGFSGFGLPPHMQQHPNQYPQQPPQRYPQGVGRDEILMVSDDRVLALRTAAGPQRYMSDNASMVSIPR
ncbi:CNH domain-containing protein [Mycena sp. CBHHK59/15]|nr:CNH domain-containing protein [Mycena sp. CBHHK59/15]